MDENSENFTSYQIFLQEKAQNDYQTLIQQLLFEVKDPNIPYNILFLSFVLIDHCVCSSRIAINAQNRYLQSALPVELVLQIFDTVFIFLLHPKITIRNKSVCIFSTLSMTQLFRLSEFGIDTRLVYMLNTAQNYEALWSATQCIWGLIFARYKFSEEQEIIIIQNLFRILNFQNENISLLQSVIRMVGEFSYLIFKIFDDNNKFLEFVIQLLNFSSQPELSEVVYQCMDDIINIFPSILPSIYDRLLSNSLADMTSPAPRNVLIALTVMWESIFSKNIPIVNESVQSLIIPLISIMQSVSTTEVIDYTEWEPYTAAFSCLYSFGYHFPDAVVPFLLEYSNKASCSENPLDREGSLKCIHIVFRISSIEKLSAMMPSILEMLLADMGDASPRVRYESVNTLRTLILIKSSDSFQLFQPFLPALFKLIGDVEPTAKLSFGVIKKLSHFKDFTFFPDLHRFLAEIMPSIPPNIIQNAVDCFVLTPFSQIRPETTLASIQFLFGLMSQMNFDSSTSSSDLIITFCNALSSLIFHCNESLAPFVENISNMMYSLFNTFNISETLQVVATTCVPLPLYVESQLSTFVPFIFRALQMFESPSVLVPTVSIVPLLVKRINLGPYFENLISAMFASLQKGETFLCKIETLESLYSILHSHSAIFTPFIGQLHGSVLFIIDNLEIAYKRYAEATEGLVRVICKIQIKLMEILHLNESKHIFESCVKLFIAVSKIPPLIQYNNVDLYKLLNSMFLVFPAETKLIMMKVPETTQILRVYLKQIHKSDKEIDDLLEIFNRNDENQLCE